jgi:DNA-binding transcriptional ArsR family regulator
MLHQRAQREPVDRVFHALADPNRRGIVERLSLGPATVSELAEPLPMSLSAVVQHLEVLQVNGLVSSEKVGRVRTCRIEPAALRPVERWIGALVSTSPKATTNRKGARDERTIGGARHLCRRAQVQGVA